MTLSYPAALQSEHTYAIHHWQCSWCRKDASLESMMPIHAIIWSVGNESLNDTKLRSYCFTRFHQTRFSFMIMLWCAWQLVVIATSES